MSVTKSRQPVLLYDANGDVVATVKDANIAPVAADKALVVVLSPNQQPLPTTSAPLNANTGSCYGRFNYGAGAGTTKILRATTYIEQSVNFTGSIRSASANDAAAGTGARTVSIKYFDQAGAGPFTETVTLNGTTAVNLVNANHCFIESMEVPTVGALGANAGIISLFTGAGGAGTTVGSIGVGTNEAGIGDNQTFWAHHYIPIGKTASIYTIDLGTTGNQVGLAFLRRKFPLIANATEVQISDFVTVAVNGAFSLLNNSNPIVVPGFSRVAVYVISNGTNTNYFASFDYSEI